MASCPWSLSENPVEIGLALGRKMGFQGEDAKDLVEFLRTQSAEDICKAVESIHAELKSVNFCIHYYCIKTSVFIIMRKYFRK